MEIDLEKLLPLIGKDGAGLARELFREYRKKLTANVKTRKEELQARSIWEAEVEKAAADLEAWRQQSGRGQAYTAESLAEARLAREMAIIYEDIYSFPLKRANTDHLAVTCEEMKRSNFRRKLIREGEEDRKLGLVELSARLLPTLDFPNSSIYFEGGVVPYGKGFRLVISEAKPVSFVTAAVAEESAANLQRTFGVHYALAETSAAPRNDVPKSGKKPEIYICGLAGDKVYSEHHVIDTPFREEFNAVVRELMYGMLRTMYGVSK